MPAATASLHSCSSVREEEGTDTEGMEVTDEEESRVRLETPLLLSWKRLQSILGGVFGEAIQLKGHNSYQLLHCLEHLHGDRAKTSKRFGMARGVDMLSAMCVQLSRTISTLLTAASNEELHLIMEQLLCIKVRTVHVMYLLSMCKH